MVKKKKLYTDTRDKLWKKIAEYVYSSIWINIKENVCLFILIYICKKWERYAKM